MEAAKKQTVAWGEKAPRYNLHDGAMGQANQGGEAIDSHSTTQVTEWWSGRFASQGMDKSLKAKENNDLGLGEDSYKPCDAWPKRSHVAMQIICYSGFVLYSSLS